MHPDWLSNAFLVAAEGGPAVFVDAGADVAPLIEAAERWGTTPVAIRRTHGHHDHIERCARIDPRDDVGGGVEMADEPVAGRLFELRRDRIDRGGHRPADDRLEFGGLKRGRDGHGKYPGQDCCN